MSARRTSIGLTLIAVASVAAAQQSASFKIEESALNSGGTPAAGASPSSASFKITLSSLGGGPSGRALSSASFRSDAGFTSAYAPPGEVAGLIFSGPDTLAWNADPSATAYNLYRDLHSNLSGLGFGQCEQQGLSGTSATDGDAVPAGDGFFYLVTALNRLDEEGGKGAQSDGTERGGNVCP